MADWVRIRTEYITTDTSYRKLAAKYGISLSVLGDRASREKWQNQREQHRANVLSKSVDKITDVQVARMLRIMDLADKLLDKLEKAIDELDIYMATYRVKTRVRNTEECVEHEECVEYKVPTKGLVNIAGLRQLVSALKDLKAITGVISDLERQEREARIEALRRKSGSDDEDDRNTGVILVTFRKDMPDDAAEKIVV